MIRRCIVTSALLCLAAPAQAFTESGSSLPMLALAPAVSGAPGPIGQSATRFGFYSGIDKFGFSGSGMPGSGFGGTSAFAGYNQRLTEKFFVDFRTSSGFAPGIFQRGQINGYDLSGASVKFGYDMGRFTPFVAASFTAASPIVAGNPFGGPVLPYNNLFNTAPTARTAARIGAGFDFAVTDNLKFGFGVSAGTGQSISGP